MDLQSLTPATQAVLKALVDLGQGNVHELAEKSGKARSTVDKALRTLSEAGLIVEVDLGADPAEGTPTRWTLSQDTAAALDAADLTDEATAGLHETGDDPDTGSTDEADTAHDRDTGDTTTGERSGQDRTDAARPPARPGDRKVMTIKGVLAEYADDGATLELIVAETGINPTTAARLLTAMEQADAARRLPGLPQRWIPGPTKASEVDPDPQPPRCPLCFQLIRGATVAPSAVAAVQPLIRPDRTLHILNPHGETQVVALPNQAAPRPAAGPRPVGRGDATLNADGNQPFARGELERLSIDVLKSHPGEPMSPQDIANEISANLGGRAVSPGAVRNNLTKAAAAGLLTLFSEAPLLFVYRPAPAGSTDDTGAGGETDAEQADNPPGDESGADNGQY